MKYALICVAAALLLAAFFVVVFFIRRKKVGISGIDSIVGENCIVTEKIDNFAGCGQASVNGQSWSARGVCEDDKFQVGEVLQIVAIEGVKLICRKKK